MNVGTIFRYVGYALRAVSFDLLGNKRRGAVAIGKNVSFDPRLKVLLGKKVYIGPNAVFQGEGAVSIGAGTYVGAGFSCNAMKQITIGDSCMMGNYVSIIDNNHGTRRGINMIDQPLESHSVEISSNCWLGEKATVLAGVRIGEGAIVAAGAVVTRDVQPYTVVAGVPARSIKSIPPA